LEVQDRLLNCCSGNRVWQLSSVIEEFKSGNTYVTLYRTLMLLVSRFSFKIRFEYNLKQMKYKMLVIDMDDTLLTDDDHRYQKRIKRCFKSTKIGSLCYFGFGGQHRQWQLCQRVANGYLYDFL
jgi:hypothetical protein